MADYSNYNDPILTQMQIKQYWPEQGGQNGFTSSTASALIIYATGVATFTAEDIKKFHVTPEKIKAAHTAAEKLIEAFPQAAVKAGMMLDEQGKTWTPQRQLIQELKNKAIEERAKHPHAALIGDELKGMGVVPTNSSSLATTGATPVGPKVQEV